MGARRRTRALRCCWRRGIERGLPVSPAFAMFAADHALRGGVEPEARCRGEGDYREAFLGVKKALSL